MILLIHYIIRLHRSNKVRHRQHPNLNPFGVVTPYVRVTFTKLQRVV